MIAVEQTVGVLLAAGRSTRFGNANKLLQPLGGQPLILHAAKVLGALGCVRMIAVVPPDEPRLGELLAPLGFELLVNPAPGPEQHESLRLALMEVLTGPATAALVCLADMPFVTTGHLQRLLVHVRQYEGAVSTGATWRTPPVVFTRSLISRLAMVSSPRALRDIIQGSDIAPLACDDAELRDLDTVADFEALDWGRSGGGSHVPDSRGSSGRIDSRLRQQFVVGNKIGG